MINSYEIKKINGQDTLFLYFDIDMEFSLKENKQKLEKVVKDFIKKNKIAFKGTIVTLVVGGLTIGKIALNKPKEIVNTKSKNEVVEIIKEDSLNNETKTTELTNENESHETKNVDTNKGSSASINENTNVNNETEVKNENVKEEIKEEVVDNNTYVTIYRSNGSVITLELEEYVVGVVGAEMPAAFNSEALKAQAVLARTYALKSLSTGKTLTDTNSTQNYKDNNELQNQWGSSFNTYYNKVKSAVNDTKGVYLTYNGQYIEAVYHSTSNGQTEDSSNVWDNYYPYLVSVNSSYDSSNPSFNYEKIISYTELSSKLNTEVNNDTEFNILDRTSGNRVGIIEINGKTFTGVSFRNLVGLRSADFEIIKRDNDVLIKTKGYGHGVGMSQYGANGMANNGYSYQDILTHYYKGVTLNYL